jgi:hypothetical protein
VTPARLRSVMIQPMLKPVDMRKRLVHLRKLA